MKKITHWHRSTKQFPLKICSLCKEKTFTPTNNRQLYCSKKCSRDAYIFRNFGSYSNYSKKRYENPEYKEKMRNWVRKYDAIHPGRHLSKIEISKMIKKLEEKIIYLRAL